jgi:homoserine O-acetyltransferase/O-succinyltransferase
MEKPPGDSVGIVKTQYFTFAHAPNEMPLEKGGKLGPITVAYETYGNLNKDKTNAIVVCHALSGDAHAAGYYSDEDIKGTKKVTGWWDLMIGPGKAIDTNKYFVICSNILGSCYGTTGPSSINPATGKEYAMTFPEVTIPDMVKVQKYLLDSLGIEKLISVIGGSIGGMQALEWSLQFPDIPKSVVVIAASAALSAQEIALDAVGRNAIKMDSQWEGGNYYGKERKLKGLAVARMIGHISYLSEEGMDKKFGRKPEDPVMADSMTPFEQEFEKGFAVEGYLAHQGQKFVDRFDANAYLYVTKAMDYFDVDNKYGGGSLTKAIKRIKAEVMMISFTSDWLFSPAQAKEIVQALTLNDKDVSYIEIKSIHGHDAFLLDKKSIAENKILGQAFKNFLLHIK